MTLRRCGAAHFRHDGGVSRSQVASSWTGGRARSGRVPCGEAAWLSVQSLDSADRCILEVCFQVFPLLLVALVQLLDAGLELLDLALLVVELLEQSRVVLALLALLVDGLHVLA